jgi:hypothetical protein
MVSGIFFALTPGGKPLTQIILTSVEINLKGDVLVFGVYPGIIRTCIKET